MSENHAPPSRYLHGTSPEEQDRLSLLNDILNERSLRELGLTGGERILDVGCGLAQFARCMARQSGRTVVGVERDADQLRAARLLAAQAGEDHAVELRQGDASSPPLRDDEWGTFDVAHARFLLEHVPDPEAVVRVMLRAVRPGGRVVIEDDGHDTFRLHPEPLGFDRLWRAYMRTYDRAGNDPLVGHRLVSLLCRAGAIPKRNALVSFGGCAGEPELMAALVENLVGILRGVRGPLLELGEFGEAYIDASLAAIREWGRLPDAALWYAVSWAEGTAPGDGKRAPEPPYPG